jgi:hypothetical protein
MRSVVPAPPYEEFRTEIVFRGERFHVEQITHRRGHERNVRYEVVVFPGANLNIRKAACDA